tara:strand:- start:58 stop:510 length:453 start_codon:yes stop_codon:yes gene_type:complete
MRSDVLNTSSNSYGKNPEVYKFSAKTANFSAVDGHAYLVTKLDGCAVTLPAPTIGAKIKIVFGAVTSNAHTITCDATTTLLSGYALMLDNDGTAAQCKVFAPDESDDDVMSLNGGTTGISGTVELLGVSDKMWQVQALIYSAGTVATPFA